MSRVEKKLVKAQRAFAAICSCARNAYSREQLKADFQDGLAEMHAQANKGAPSGLALVLPAPCHVYWCWASSHAGAAAVGSVFGMGLP